METLVLVLGGITPSSTSTLPVVIDVDLLCGPNGPDATGTINILANGQPFGSGIPWARDTEQHVQATLPSGTPAGTYSITAYYSGDANFNPCNSDNSFTFTNNATGGGSGGGGTDPGTPTGPVVSPTSPGGQAIAYVSYQQVDATQPRTRAQIEEGELAASAFKVMGTVIRDTGAGRYDANTKAVLVGAVAGVANRESLTIALNDTGGISAVAGFNPDTQWDEPPRLVITRWSGPGEGATFLGY